MGLFSNGLVERAEDEFSTYEGLLEHEADLRQRIGEYWDFLGEPDRDGATGEAWSAAFISFMVHLAGGGDRFRYDGQHSVYFHQHIGDRLAGAPQHFWGYRPEEVEIEPGDILGMNRTTAPPLSFDMAAGDADYSSHANIVVRTDDAGVIHTIGGNVRLPGEVGRKTFEWRDGQLVNQAQPVQQVFVVLRNFLP